MTLRFPVRKSPAAPYRDRMDKTKSTTQATYKTSEAARKLGVSAEWLRKGEERGFFLQALRDPQTGHRFYTRRDIERLKVRRLKEATRG